MFFKFLLFFAIMIASWYFLSIIYGFLFDREYLPWPFNCGDR